MYSIIIKITVSIILIIKIFTVREAIERIGSKTAFASSVRIPPQNVNRISDAKLVAMNERGEYTLVKNEDFWHG
jgi:hypothetical protein